MEARGNVPPVLGLFRAPWTIWKRLAWAVLKLVKRSTPDRTQVHGFTAVFGMAEWRTGVHSTGCAGRREERREERRAAFHPPTLLDYSKRMNNRASEKGMVVCLPR